MSPIFPGIHAEGTVLNGAGQFGLTPTVGIATNNVCSDVCGPRIRAMGGWVNEEKFGFQILTEEMAVTDDERMEALRNRRSQPASRIDMDTLAVPPLYPRAMQAELDDAERKMGFQLPDILKRIYTDVGNGGFGPGGGLIGVGSGYPDAEGRRLPEAYACLRTEGWPEKLLPLWDWGGGSWSCVDAAATEGSITTMDESGRTLTPFSLRSWLEQWANGTDMHDQIYVLEEATIVNPFTRKPMAIKRRARPKGKPVR